MLGSKMTGVPAPPGSIPRLMGLFAHFFLGSVVFSLIYAYLVYPILSGANWLRGVMWSTILWFLLQIVVMPITGKGIFASDTPDQAKIVFGSLIFHWIYGAILGSIAGQQTLRHSFHPQERRA
jgi:hypothetical protein